MHPALTRRTFPSTAPALAAGTMDFSSLIAVERAHRDAVVRKRGARVA